jgi:hypothetical protein
VRSQLELPGARAGAEQLASVSSFGGEEPLRLPFDLQRHHLFLAAVALVAMALVAAATGLSPLIGVGLIAAIALAFAVALNEVIGLVLLAALVPAASGLARGLPVPGLRLSETLIAGVGGILLVSARRFVRWTALDWLALAYALTTFVLGFWDLIDRGQSVSRSEIDLLLGPVQFLLLYRATVVAARTPERRRLALRLLLWASVPVSLLALGQQFNAPGIRSFVVTLTGTDVYAAGSSTARVTGPFPLWHNLGGYLFLILLTIAALLIRRVPGVLSRNALIGIAVLDTAALVETLDIAPIAAVIAGLLILGVWLRSFTRLFIGLAVVLVAGALVLGPRLGARFSQEFGRAPGTQRSALVPQTIQYRYDLWTSELLPLLKGHVITGYGPQLPPELQNFPYTESQYVNFLYRGGVVLLVVWFGLFVVMCHAGVRSSRHRDSLQQALGAMVATALVCLLFMQLIEAYFVDDGTPQVLWVLLGLLAFREAAPAALERRGRLQHPITRRAWAGSVAMAVETLDLGSRELLRWAYHHQLSDSEIVEVLGLSTEAISRWRRSAVQRLAIRTSMSPTAVEQVLRSGSAGT